MMEHFGSIFNRLIRIMVVEDSVVFQAKIQECLGEDCTLDIFGDAESALAQATTTTYDMVLLDVVLPGMTGHDLLPRLRAMEGYKDVPIIMMTSLEKIEHKRQAFTAGANDYIIKPYEVEEVRMRVAMHLQLAANRAYLSIQKRTLELQVREQHTQILKTLNASIAALAALAETRDNETGGHIQRTMHYMDVLAKALLSNPKTSAELEGLDLETMVKTAPLHDIGKVGIPDSILLKPGPLTPEEWVIMETHTTLGSHTLEKAEQEAGESAFIYHAKRMCISHHEKWDGSGYPQGISGKAIPIEGRLMALCDVYDALICKRHYKEPFTHARALSIIKEGRGRHFDPDFVDTFLAHAGEIRGIALANMDSEQERLNLLID